jgi:hypothetical protein
MLGHGQLAPLDRHAADCDDDAPSQGLGVNLIAESIAEVAEVRLSTSHDAKPCPSALRQRALERFVAGARRVDESCR